MYDVLQDAVVEEDVLGEATVRRYTAVGATLSALVAALITFMGCSGLSQTSLPNLTTPQLSVTATIAPNEFIGRWKSTDKDGSTQTLAISHLDAVVLTLDYADDVATHCGGNPATATATGTPAGDTLSVSFVVYCENPKAFWGNAPYTFTYTKATDTMADNYGVVWHRNTP
jgi:hypothetical protein